MTSSGGAPGPDGQSFSMTSEVKLVDGKPVRMKMMTPDGYRLMMTDEHTVYNVNTKDKTATRSTMPAPGAAPGGAPVARARSTGRSPRRRTGRGGRRAAGRGRRGRGMGGGRFDPADVARYNPTSTSTTLGGVACYLVQYKNDRGDQIQAWVDKQYGLPRQSVSPRGTTTFTYSKINSVPASDFELPTGSEGHRGAAGGRGGWGGPGGGGQGGQGGQGGGGAAARGGGGQPPATPRPEAEGELLRGFPAAAGWVANGRLSCAVADDHPRQPPLRRQASRAGGRRFRRLNAYSSARVLMVSDLHDRARLEVGRSRLGFVVTGLFALLALAGCSGASAPGTSLPADRAAAGDDLPPGALVGRRTAAGLPNSVALGVAVDRNNHVFVVGGSAAKTRSV